MKWRAIKVEEEEEAEKEFPSIKTCFGLSSCSQRGSCQDTVCVCLGHSLSPTIPAPPQSSQCPPGTREKSGQSQLHILSGSPPAAAKQQPAGSLSSSSLSDLQLLMAAVEAPRLLGDQYVTLTEYWFADAYWLFIKGHISADQRCLVGGCSYCDPSASSSRPLTVFKWRHNKMR